MSLALLFHYFMLNMLKMLIHPSSGACDLFVEIFHGLYCSGTMRVGVTVWYHPSQTTTYRFADSLRAGSGQRNCPNHVEFYPKNKFEKLVYLVGLVIRVFPELPTYLGQMVSKEFVFTDNKCC